ncbi:YdcF family protein [Microbacterium telephonicum]|uniref:Uncharacterized SAM-binding protein YcdF (DUF218 family) n=1 Tax=Microbacterium telephonicum TaxID=1714841 RepID=A0A498C8R1_9MICO|nr:YdcF family protein [Microbacterium telephonicum]RLK52444.1 uncharacterized SAM-binding protein YcdF (DUF218 family) [Microbacterium telephonicum]
MSPDRRGRGTAGARGAIVGAALVGAAVLAGSEWRAWRISRAGYPDAAEPGPPDGADVVVVLGYPGRRDGSPGIVQRWRTRIARRSAPPDALFVFTGGAVHGDVPEAVTMARYAQRLGIRTDRIVRETRATTTRENLALSLPWLVGARSIRLASDTGHARRARQYLRELDPALHARLLPTRDFLPLETGPLRLALLIHDAVAARVRAHRARRALGPHP